MYDSYMQMRELSYRPVRAYTADRPILVNDYDINTGVYPVLNFRPKGARYPYIYVPIAEFSRVGATVNWDEARQLLSVKTDYYQMKSQYQELQEKDAQVISDLKRNYSEIERLTAENESLKAQLNQ